MTENNKKITMELDQLEVWQIQQQRGKYRFGEIVVVMHDGLPQRFRKVELNIVPPQNNGK
jgi:hypothetical protein